MALISAAAVAGGAGGALAGAAEAAPAGKDPMPMGRIGKQEYSRLMLGGNLASGYAHARDLAYVSDLMRHYNTEAKIRETLELAESHGINVINLWIMSDYTYLRSHWKNGGKMKFIAQARTDREDPLVQFKKAVDEGASAVHINGDSTDDLSATGQVALIGKAVEYVKSRGVVSGIAAHGLKGLEMCVQAGFEPDFYQKTLHPLDYRSAPRGTNDFLRSDLGTWDNGWCRYPEEVIDFMGSVKKPWIAFKVMAAGAVSPQVAFPFAVNGGADFVLAGMFDWQVADDVRLIKEAFRTAKRTRPLYG